MSDPTGNVAVCEAYDTQDTPTTPVLAGWRNARFLGPCLANVFRAGATGAGAIVGVNLPGINGRPDDIESSDADDGRCLPGSDDGIGAATGRSYFYVDIPFVALSGNNWVCIREVAGVYTVQAPASAATTSAGEFYVETYDSGNKIKLTIGASVAGGEVDAGDKIWIFYVPSAASIATVAAQQFDQIECDGRDVVWYDPDNTETPSATSIYLQPVGE